MSLLCARHYAQRSAKSSFPEAHTPNDDYILI